MSIYRSQSNQSTHTYSTAVRSPHYVVLIELEILVEDVLIQLDFAVEFVANLLPVGSGLGHVQMWGIMVCESQACGAAAALRWRVGGGLC